jgi:hypothetical protein
MKVKQKLFLDYFSAKAQVILVDLFIFREKLLNHSNSYEWGHLSKLLLGIIAFTCEM